MITRIYLPLFLWLASLPVQAQPLLQTGDLLFQDLDCGPFCEAIESVTKGVDGLDFSHVGMAWVKEDTVWVVEAIGKGVVLTPLDTFLARSNDSLHRPKVLVARLKDEYLYSIPPALEKNLSLMGEAYDEGFDLSNDRYYCSELLYFAFTDSSGHPLFETAPMTFTDPATGNTFPAWTEYFHNLGIPVPEGQPGLNPGGISRSGKLEVVYRYY